MKYETMELVQRLGYFMLEGNTYDETSEEFKMNREKVKRLINEKLKLINPKVFNLIKNRPYMVFQRAVYKKCSIEEALAVFNVSKKRFDSFLLGIYETNPKKYVDMRNKMLVANVKYSRK